MTANPDDLLRQRVQCQCHVDGENGCNAIHVGTVESISTESLTLVHFRDQYGQQINATPEEVEVVA